MFRLLDLDFSAIFGLVALAAVVILVVRAVQSSEDGPGESVELRESLADLFVMEPDFHRWSSANKYQFAALHTGISWRTWNEMFPEWRVSEETAKRVGKSLGRNWEPSRYMGPI